MKQQSSSIKKQKPVPGDTEGKNARKLKSPAGRLLRLRGVIYSGVNLPEKIHHLNGAQSTVIAFIACLRSGAFDGLLDIFCGEDAEKDRETDAIPLETSLHT